MRLSSFTRISPRRVLWHFHRTNGTSSVLTRLLLGKRHQTLTTSDDPYAHSTCSCTSPCHACQLDAARGSTLTVQGYGTVGVVRVDKKRLATWAHAHFRELTGFPSAFRHPFGKFHRVCNSHWPRINAQPKSDGR
jgi:hypothetical protein